MFGYSGHGEGCGLLGVCLFKRVTGIPCFSCGATRSLILLLEGNIKDAFYMNPVGFILAALLLILPVWVVYDLLAGRSSFFNFYRWSEKVLLKKPLLIVACLLVLANWVWNIAKGL